VNRADFERVGGVERKDPAVATLKLRVDGRAQSGDGEQYQEGGDERTAKHSRGLLTTTAWKSKRLVSTARRQ
jgi:hypothetical protein